MGEEKAQRLDGDQPLIYHAECFHKNDVDSTQRNLFQPPHLQLPFVTFQLPGKDFTEK